MHPSILLLSLVWTAGFQSVQTDWSGGPGLPGPYPQWGDGFDTCSSVDWTSSPGSILPVSIPGSFAMHPIGDGQDYCCSLDTCDVNEDGWTDIVSAASYSGQIVWWRNEGGTGSVWTPVPVAVIGDAVQVSTGDFDGDGLQDFLVCATGSYLVSWFERTNEPGTTWTEHRISGKLIQPRCAVSSDLDGDQDLDVICSDQGARVIYFWENPDGSGEGWIDHVVEDNFAGRWLACGDMDGDGDIDIAGVENTLQSHVIGWWENEGAGLDWSYHQVAGSVGDVRELRVGDIDSDGACDIVAGNLSEDGSIKWWRNCDGVGTSWQAINVDTDLEMAYTPKPVDIDRDGDLDLAGIYRVNGFVAPAWWENVVDYASEWPLHAPPVQYLGANSSITGDINSDGNTDLACASWSQDALAWWEATQFCPAAHLESSILDTGCDPGWAYIGWACETGGESAVTFELRSSGDGASWSPWQGDIVEPCVVPFPLERYIQYRAYMFSGSCSETARLLDMSLQWDATGTEDASSPIQPWHRVWPLENPAEGDIQIAISTSEPGSCLIELFDLSGRLVWTSGRVEPGIGTSVISVRKLTPGLYLGRYSMGRQTGVFSAALLR